MTYSLHLLLEHTRSALKLEEPVSDALKLHPVGAPSGVGKMCLATEGAYQQCLETVEEGSFLSLQYPSKGEIDPAEGSYPDRGRV